MDRSRLALTPAPQPARTVSMPVYRIEEPRNVARNYDLPREAQALAYKLHAARGRNSPAARQIEDELVAWMLSFGVTDELYEVPCCDSCGQELAPRTTARIALAEAACSSIRMAARKWKRGVK